MNYKYQQSILGAQEDLMLSKTKEINRQAEDIEKIWQDVSNAKLNDIDKESSSKPTIRARGKRLDK